VPPNVVDKDFWRLVVQYQFYYSVTGLLVSLFCLVNGVLMFVHGFTGSSSWSADLFGITINDAAPGTVLFVIGLAIAHFTKFDVRLGRKEETPSNLAEQGD